MNNSTALIWNERGRLFTNNAQMIVNFKKIIIIYDN